MFEDISGFNDKTKLDVVGKLVITKISGETAGGPKTNVDGMVVSFRTSPRNAAQIVFESSQWYYRLYWATSWSPWKQIPLSLV